MRRPWVIGAAAVVVALSLSASPDPAGAAEAQVGSSGSISFEVADFVPQLRVGSSAKRASTEEGELFVVNRSKRCGGFAFILAVLTDASPIPLRRLRPIGSRLVRVRGGGERALRLSAYQGDFGGVDPASAVVLTGELPPGLASAESRRRLVVFVSFQSEDGKCRRAVARRVRRIVPSVYLRAVNDAAPLVKASRSQALRVDSLGLDRVGGPDPRQGLGEEIEPAGDLDGDGLGDTLLQGEEPEVGNLGGLVRFGGRPELADGRALGSRGFGVLGPARDAALGSGLAAPGDFDGDGRADLAAGLRGSEQRRGKRRPSRELAAVVIPGRRYRGRIDARRPPAGSTRITLKPGRPGCSGGETNVAGVGDVNGDGLADLAVERSDGCLEGNVGIVFGGTGGTIRLDALGPRGIALDPDESPGGFAPAGDVNGDGLGDVALRREFDRDVGDDDLVLLLGRRSPGRVVTKTDPGVVRLSRRGCNDLVDVAPAGDLDGDGADELAIGVADCDDRKFNPTVAEVLRGSPGLRGRVRLRDASAVTIRSRFGPLRATQIVAGRDVIGGRAADLAIGFPEGGAAGHGEVWLLSDVRLGEQLTLGALGGRGLRLNGGPYGENLGTDLAMSGDTTGDGRADLLIGASQSEFAGRTGAGAVYTFSPVGRTGPRCSSARSGSGRLRGTDGGDRLTGSRLRDRIVGFIGADCLFGAGGDDFLIGDPGDDLVEGGPGADRLFGGTGRDTLRGGPGPDFLTGGTQPDTLEGGTGSDRIDARELGGDRVAAGPGSDFIRASDRALDSIDCGPGRDRVIADPGDRLRGCERVTRRQPVQYDD